MTWHDELQPPMLGSLPGDFLDSNRLKEGAIALPAGKLSASSGFPRKVAIVLFVHLAIFVAFVATIVTGMWRDQVAWTFPALGCFILSSILLVPLGMVRGIPAGFADRYDRECHQALTRVIVSSLLEAYLIWMLASAPRSAVPYIALAHVGLGMVLMPLVLFLLQPRRDTAARIVSALSDNIGFTLVLLSDQAYAMAIWPFYLWASFGNGFRFGIRPMVYNVILSLVGFAVVVELTPSWHRAPALTVGLFLSLIFLPAYAAGLIRRLHAATEEATIANAAKTRFIAVMSHELRTPLSAMLGSVAMLRGSALNEDQNRLLQVVTGSGQSLLSMINELLDFSAIETGKTHFELRDVQIFELAVATVNTLAMAAEEKNLRLAIHVDCRLPAIIRTDGEHVRRIITNLVWNAIKFTRTGRIDVSLLSSADRAGLTIEVQDTGVGIPADKQSKIFDPFVQGDDRVERAYEGVGLGLAIIRELVSLHRGRISLKSQVNVGSRFTVELPFAAAEAPPDPSPDAIQGERLAIIAGSGPLASGGLIDSCRDLGISCSFTDPEPALLRKALGRIKLGSGVIVFLSYRDMALGGQMAPDRFDAIVAMVEVEKGVPVLVLGDADNDEAVDRYRMRVPATIKGPDPAQLANLLRFVDMLDPKHAATDAAGYAAQKKCRILLVEDNATNRFITTRALGDAGHEVITAASGDEALNALDQSSFDVVVMDINMPGLNGIEATKIIRTINYTDNLRIIGLTADVTQETKRRCLDAGMDLVLTKPASIPVMLKAIDDLVSHGVTAVRSEKVTPIEANSRFRARRAAVLDDTGFQRLKDIGDPTFIRESLTLFLAEAVDLIRELDQALDEFDRGKAYDVFHSLKGICANVGAMRLREVLNTSRAADNLVADRKTHIKRLREELVAFQTEAIQRVPDLDATPLPFG